MLARSGIVFPQRLGKFVRTGISSLEQGRIGAQYALPDDPAGATVDLFVRPVAEPVDEEFAATEATVRRLYSNIVLVRDLPAPAGLPLALGRLWKGSLGGEEVLTGMIISHRAGWRIKLRATVSADRGEELWADVDGLIRAFDWGAPRT